MRELVALNFPSFGLPTVIVGAFHPHLLKAAVFYLHFRVWMCPTVTVVITLSS